MDNHKQLSNIILKKGLCSFKVNHQTMKIYPLLS